MKLRRVLSIFASLTLIVAILGCCGCPGSKPATNNGKSVSFDVQIENAMKESSPSYKAGTLINIANEQIKAGASSGAKKTLKSAHEAAEEVMSDQERADLFAQCAEAQFAASDRSNGRKSLKKAVEGCNKIKDPEGQAKGLAKIAVLQFTVDEKSDATKTLKQAEELAATVAAPQGQVSSYVSIAKAYHDMENVDQANQVLNSVLEQAKAGADPIKKYQMLAEIGAAQAELGDKDGAKSTLELAVATVEEIKAENEEDPKQLDDQYNARAHALIRIGERFYQSGFTGEAKKTLAAAEAAGDKVKDGSFKNSITEALTRVKVMIHEGK